MNRQIVLDTETTGLNPKDGHKIIEIGCVEIINRKLTGNNLHFYINPEREIEQEAIDIHGITNSFLIHKPKFNQIVDEFIDYIRGAELIAHNARFDVSFLDHEISLLDYKLKIADCTTITDTLAMAKRMHPGQRNSLDALCKRYKVDNSNRELHGALLDAELLANVYLAMTGGQVSFSFDLYQTGTSIRDNNKFTSTTKSNEFNALNLKVISATEHEIELHEKFLQKVRASSDNNCIWDKIEVNQK